MVFCGAGVTNGSTQLAPGLNVSVVGSTAPASIIPKYTSFYGTYNLCPLPLVLTGVFTTPVQSTTAVALAITVNSDLYVLPAAFFVVPSGPPTLTSLKPGTDGSGNGLLTVYGTSLSTATQFVFDGTVATSVQNPDGSFTLSAPPAPGSYSSSIEALNPDGQTSGQANPYGTPPQYTYNYANPAAIALSSSSVSPGTDAMITITGYNTNFNSQTMVGFGTSDIVVKPNQVFVTSPTSLLVNASVSSLAPTLTAANVTVTTGLQTATSSQDLGTGAGIQIVSAGQGQISMYAPIANVATLLAGVTSPGTAIINASGVSQNLTGWTLTIAGQPAPLEYVNNQLQASVPSGLSLGTQIATLTSPTGATASLAMTINPAPPTLQSVINPFGVTILSSSSTPVHPGDILTLNLFGPNGTPLSNSNLFASLGGIVNGMNAQNAVTVPVLASNSSLIQIQIPYAAPLGSSIPLYVGTGTNVSSAFLLNISN
jgi:uncharacterized protein (TIGR03437 family)